MCKHTCTEETSNPNRVVYSNTHAFRYAQFFMLYISVTHVLFLQKLKLSLLSLHQYDHKNTI